MDWNFNDIMGEMAKIVGGGTAGVFGGMWAERRAAKSDAVQELQMLKTEYREFASTMKTEVKEVRAELDKSREAEAECHAKHREAMNRIDELDRGIRALMQMPEKPKRNGN
jgi:biopolymer transport protein ExbB/TolQ